MEVGAASTLDKPIKLTGRVVSPRAMDWKTQKQQIQFKGSANNAGSLYADVAGTSVQYEGFIDGPFHLSTTVMGSTTNPLVMRHSNCPWGATYVQPTQATAVPCAITSQLGLPEDGTETVGTNLSIPWIYDKPDNTGGWTCFAINALGLPASAAGVLEIDVIMHVEAIGNIIAGAVSYEGSAASYQPHNQPRLESALRANASVPLIRQ